MKRVNVRNGLKQRMNELLGTDSGLEGDVPGITAWSIESAMIDNIRRVAAAIVGNSPGRPMRGLWLTQNTDTSIAISAGYGFTPTGDIVVLAVGVTSDVSDITDGDKHFYLRHKMAEIDGDIYEDGKKTGFIGKSGTENIVYDDFAASKKDTIQTHISEVLEESATIIPSDPDLVYLGYVTMSGGVITAVVNSSVRGLAPNDNNGKYRIPGLHVTGESDFDGAIALGSSADINVDGDASITEDVDVRDSAGTGVITLKFKNGLFIGHTP